MTAVEFLRQATQARKQQKRVTDAFKKALDDLEQSAKVLHATLEESREGVMGELVDDDAEYDERDEGIIESLENMSVPDEYQLGGVREMLAEWEKQGAELDAQLLVLAEEITERKRAR